MTRTAPRHERNTKSPQGDDSRNMGMSESEIDQVLADSFPASDPPPWTLGVRRLSRRASPGARDSNRER
jgi:hypothetical protein